MSKCVKCGFAEVDDAAFCYQCGSPIPRPEPQPAGTAALNREPDIDAGAKRGGEAHASVGATDTNSRPRVAPYSDTNTQSDKPTDQAIGPTWRILVYDPSTGTGVIAREAEKVGFSMTTWNSDQVPVIGMPVSYSVDSTTGIAVVVPVKPALRNGLPADFQKAGKQVLAGANRASVFIGQQGVAATKQVGEELANINQARRQTFEEGTTTSTTSRIESGKVLLRSFWEKLTVTQTTILILVLALPMIAAWVLFQAQAGRTAASAGVEATTPQVPPRTAPPAPTTPMRATLAAVQRHDQYPCPALAQAMENVLETVEANLERFAGYPDGVTNRIETPYWSLAERAQRAGCL